MPGVLKSLGNSSLVSECSEAFARHTSGNMAFEDASKRGVVDGQSRTNGILPADMEVELAGIQANGFTTQSHGSTSNEILSAEEQSRPPLPEIEHITFGYVPISKLITRLCQQTFNDLTEVIDDMANSPVSQLNHSTGSQINGVGIVNTSQANVQKKLRILNFAQERRAQFIKILVLSQWSRQVEAISKVIDLKVWLDGRRRVYEEASVWMGELRRLLEPLKMPNADIKTAIVTFSSSNARWLPDLGYIPPPPLSPQEILQTLRRINVLLSIRLNLHENIPPPLRNFSISSGRATFYVRNEFELDISIGDEDPSSQLYFIDFRFSFSPVPTDMAFDKLRPEIEANANELLRRDGLSSCFTFLHNLVLTHKINVLRSQAHQMAQGLWSEHLKVETVHRSLILQYWLNKPGGKHWIEIGIKRQLGSSVLQRSSNHNIPYIAVRWFRNSKEIFDVQIKLKMENLSAQELLKHVIATHTSKIFEEMANGLRQTPLYSEKLLRLYQKVSLEEPLDASLVVQLTCSKAVKIIQEPITGKFALLPSSPLHSVTERELNSLSDPATDASGRIANLRSMTSLDEVGLSVRNAGWEEVKSLNPGQETLRRLFRQATRIGFFRRRSWSSNWVLAFTTSLSGDLWWIVELGKGKSGVDMAISLGNSIPKPGLVFKGAYLIPLVGFKSLIAEPSPSNLAHIEHVAAGMISECVNTRQLTSQKIKHELGLPLGGKAGATPAILAIKSSQCRAPAPLLPHDSLSPSWLREVVALNFHGLDQSTHSAIHTAAARLRNPIPRVGSISSTVEESLAFHPTSGAFAFRLLNSVGESTIPLLIHRLSSIECLVHFLAAIREHQLMCSYVSLDRVEFIYSTTPSELKATIHFPSDSLAHISLNESNPHLRIQDFLTSLLQSNGLGDVIFLLQSTLPLLRVLSHVEASYLNDQISILSRSAHWYQVRYQSPPAKFDIKLRGRRDELLWFLKDVKQDKGEKPLDLIALSGKTVEISSNKAWRRLSDGLVASLEGVEELIGKIDEVYRLSTRDASENLPAERSGKKRKIGDDDDDDDDDDVVVLD